MNDAFFDECELHFANRNLYKIFNLHETATSEDLHRIFMIFSREYHPDRATKNEKKKATEKFQCLNQAYYILKTPESRKLYDEHLNAPPVYIAPDDLLNDCKLNFQGVLISLVVYWNIYSNLLFSYTVCFKVLRWRNKPSGQHIWTVGDI